MHLVLGAPITAADMDAGLDAVDAVDDAVDKVYCEFEFRTRITAASCKYGLYFFLIRETS